ncbi:MAG: DUF3575 domain-containing protein [Bacteroidota bacterium]
MKKLFKNCLSLAVLLSALFFGNQTASAQRIQDYTYPNNIVKFNLLTPAFGEIEGSYERVLSKHVTFQITAFYNIMERKNNKFDGYGVMPEIRYYLFNYTEAPVGLYIAPVFLYQKMSMSGDFNNTDANPGKHQSQGELNTTGGGAFIGYQTLIANKLSLGIYGGPVYNQKDFKLNKGYESDLHPEYFTDWKIRGGITAGWAF